MNNFLVCINAVLPIFLTMAAGYAARLLGVLKREDVTRINRIAFRVFIPAMVFYNIYSSELSSAVQPRLIIFACVGVLMAFAVCTVVANKFVKDAPARGVAIQGAFRSNFVIIGLPMALSLLGDTDMGAVAILLAVVIPIYNVLAVIILSVNNGQKPDLKSTLLNIAKNPLIIGTVLGVIISVMKIQLPTVVQKVVKDFAGVTSPLMIFLLGAFFEFGDLRHKVGTLAAVCAARLVIIPGIMLTAGYLLGLRGVEFVALIGVFASPTATTSFPMAQIMGGDDKLAGNIVVMTSALCSFTLFVWCFLFKSLGAF